MFLAKLAGIEYINCPNLEKLFLVVENAQANYNNKKAYLENIFLDKSNSKHICKSTYCVVGSQTAAANSWSSTESISSLLQMSLHDDEDSVWACLKIAKSC